MSQDKKFLLQGTFYSAIGLVTRIASPMLMVVLARSFTQEEFGLYLSVELFVLTLARFLILGLDKGLVWYLPQNEKHGRPRAEGVFPALAWSALLALAGWLLLTLGIAIFGLSWIPAIKQTTPLFVVICAFSTLPLVIQFNIAGAFEGIRKPQYRILINQFLITSLIPLLALAFFKLGQGTNSLPLGYTLGNLIGAVVLLMVAYRFFLNDPTARHWRLPSELLHYSVPLGLTEIISSILWRVDMWMILALLGPEKTAIFGVMVILANALRTVRQSYDPLIIPIVSRMDEVALRKELPGVFSYSVNMVTSIQLLIVFALLVFPNEIMSIAGKNYAVESETLAFLLMGNLFNGFFGLTGQVLLGLGKSKGLMYINLFLLAGNIALNAWLIPLLGIRGAAIASSTMLLTSSLLLWAYQYRVTRVQLFQKHLIGNGVIICLFVAATFMYGLRIQSIPLTSRIGIAGAIWSALLLYYWSGRKHFKLR